MTTKARKQEVLKLVGALGNVIRELERVMEWNDNAGHSAEMLSPVEMDDRVMHQVSVAKQGVDKLLSAYPKARENDEEADRIWQASLMERLKEFNPDAATRMGRK